MVIDVIRYRAAIDVLYGSVYLRTQELAISLAGCEAQETVVFLQRQTSGQYFIQGPEPAPGEAVVPHIDPDAVAMISADVSQHYLYLIDRWLATSHICPCLVVGCDPW